MEFTKTYPTAEAAHRALAHQAWLTALGLPTPRLLSQRGTTVDYETVAGHHVRPRGLPAVAALLADANTAGHRAVLHRARLDRPFQLPGVGQLQAFTGPRIARVRSLLDAGTVAQSALTADQADTVLAAAAGEPAAFYKDANPRNFLVHATGIVALDFDDLTLAPFGYDLAKLLVTTAMTHGPLPHSDIQRALTAYNRRVPYPCSEERLHDWMKIHHILTAPYLGRHGYTHNWRPLAPVETRNP